MEEQAYLANTSQPLKDIARVMLDTGMRPEEEFRIEVGKRRSRREVDFQPLWQDRGGQAQTHDAC
jgi:hypothetical protein